ncbi:MAG: HAD family phosphatase [Treponema sp.]|jgi:putative hydrolase of the HAD superfamily|nr:HAD family phosphatase [Treponema sp.]
MIKCCIFDMGGVMVRDFHIAPELLPFLGFTVNSFAEIDKRLGGELLRHSRGEISEEEFWKRYTEITGRTLPPHDEALLGKFFHPRMDEPTAEIVRELKAAGIRVVAGTNVIDAHYKIHRTLGQYAVFDKVYASHLMGIAKPDPAFYEYILKAEGIKAVEAFFTDDMAENVNAASGARLNAFVYTGAAALREHLRSMEVLPN